MRHGQRFRRWRFYCIECRKIRVEVCPDPQGLARWRVPYTGGRGICCGCARRILRGYGRKLVRF